MRSRVITVPKDRQAEEMLDFDIAKQEELIELVLSEEEFSFLDRNGIIDLINNKGNTLIEDFEDDSVKGIENLLEVIKALRFKLNEFSKKSSQSQLIQNILILLEEALKSNTGVYFFF